MSDLRQAAQQALEALEWADNGYKEGEPIQVSIQHAITALRAALAEPEQQPVAWIEHGLIEAPDSLVWEKSSVGRYTPPYTAPTPRKPLTEEEIAAHWPTPKTPDYAIDFARAIEAAIRSRT